MSVTLVKGDITLTEATAILLGTNARGQVEVNPLETTLRYRYPVFFSEYRRMGRGQLVPGQLWFFRESRPWLVGAVVRESPAGITRSRYVEQSLMMLYRDWQRENLKNLAVAPLCPPDEWTYILPIAQEQLNRLSIPIWLFVEHIQGQKPVESAES